VFVFGNGVNQFIDEADMIVELGYHSFGQVVDEFHDELSQDQIAELENSVKKMFGQSSSPGGKNQIVNYRNFYPTFKADFFSEEPIDVPFFDNVNANAFYHYDSNGNILVMRVTWKSKRKVGKLTYFDENGMMNLSIKDLNYEILFVSQFTLHASTKKGNRPSFIKAAKPEKAKELYNNFVEALKSQIGVNLKCGIFAADMKINLENDGPVTIFIDSKSRE
jgi:D-tyrosyl-tRNA(Tyr) deacylase